MRGVRGVESSECGKHGEGSSFAGGRNKEESVGGFVSGVRRRGKQVKWNNLGPRYVETHTIFVDRLPTGISKKELYKAFGRYGFIKDIFISRKARQNSKGPFAFIRYNAYDARRKRQGRVVQSGTKRKITQKWVEVRRMTNGDKEHGKQHEIKDNAMARRKEVEAAWSEEQKERLQRSLLGACVKPINLREVMEFLIKEWGGPGDIKVRDVGPYRCLITFSTTEIRDSAKESQLLQSVFDEVRHHWDTLLSLSRRVWIEIMGMPTGLWFLENFDRIAKLWGKVIRYDDRTEDLGHIIVPNRISLERRSFVSW
ncbi:hypothetical protein PIB30_080383 [Stylosanthes scabra]|uniref:RRM domain-containing protein n=1 Tax=Stylosanthes scabra TaxID=79078 RepID=A0ABU6RRR8_9FABA|nr:hypothetical protein [Stylosanthes scabra]